MHPARPQSHPCSRSLGLAYQRTGNLKKTKEHTIRSLADDFENPIDLKNLGAIFGKEGDSLKDLSGVIMMMLI
jgi:hypothetical protein